MCKLVLNKYSPDKKDFSILLSFLVWLFIGFLIFFVGVNNIFALETNFENLSVQGYNNNGNSLTNPSVFNCSAGSCGMEITTNVNSYGGAWAIQSPIPLLKNHTYTLSLRIRNTAGVGITLSSKNRIAIGNSIDSVKYNYEIADYWNTLKSSVASGNYTLQFVFTPTGQASYLLVPFTTNRTITTSFMIDNIIIEDLGSEGVSQEEINNSLNNQTNTLNNSIQNSTDTITGEIDDMEQSIIDSNKETQEVIKDQFNTCSNKEISINFNNQYSFNTIGYIDTNNIIQYNEQYRISEYVKIKPGSSFTIEEKNYSANWNLCYYDENKNILSCVSQTTKTYNFPSNASYLRFNAYVVSGKDTIFKGVVCNNKIDETNDKLDNLQDSLTDSSLPNTSGYGDVAGWLPAGTIDSLINLPLTLLTSINSNAKKSCSPYNLPFINNTTIQIPCIGDYLSNLNGWGSLINIIDLCVSGFFLYKLLMSLYKEIQKVMSLNNSDANLGGIE